MYQRPVFGGAVSGKLSKEQKRERMRYETRRAAAPLLDDLRFLRETIGSPGVTPGDLRRISNLLRRLLIEGDLLNVAGPRLGKIKLQALNTELDQELLKQKDVEYYFSGIISWTGIEINTASKTKNNQVPFPEDIARAFRKVSPGNPKYVPMRVDLFLTQRVAAINNQWLNRKQVLKHIANTASGVHSSDLKNPTEKLCHKLRCCASWGLKPGTAGLQLDFSAFEECLPELHYQEDYVDVLLGEMFTTSNVIVNSPDIQKLEEAISFELGV